MTPLSEHLVAAAVEAGDVPEDVAAWVDGGAQPDPPEYAALDDVDTPAKRAGAWRIGNIGQAAWAMRKLAAAKARLDQIDADYDRQRKLIDKWRTDAAAPELHRVAWADGLLGRWALAQREETGLKTIPTPAGEVATREPSKPWSVEVADKDALLAWALANQRDDLIRPTLVPVTDVRKAVAVVEKDDGPVVYDASTGEPVPGLTAEPTRTTWVVRPAATDG